MAHFENATFNPGLIEADHTKHALAETIRRLDERQYSNGVAVFGDIERRFGRVPAQHLHRFAAPALSVFLYQLIIALDEATLAKPSLPYRTGKWKQVAVQLGVWQIQQRRGWGYDPATRVHSAG